MPDSFHLLIESLPLLASIGLLVCLNLVKAIPLWTIVLFWGALCCVIFLFPNLPQLLLLTSISILCASSLQLAIVGRNQILQTGFPIDQVVEVKGHLRFDSTCSVNGNTVLDLTLRQTKNRRGETASASGVLRGLYKEPLVILEGSELVCNGSMSVMDDNEVIFFIDHLSVSGPKRRGVLLLQRARSKVLAIITKRFALLSEESILLLKALILGQSQYEGAALRQMAIQSGCAHVMALSGMHLHCLVMLVTKIMTLVVGRRRSHWFSFPVAFTYVMLVGYKPSLVRALIMIGILKLPLHLGLKQVLTATFILQSLFFPWTIISIGSLLSYLSLTAIICLAEPVAAQFAIILPHKLALLCSTTLVATLCSAPLAIVLFGAWYPIGILVSPVIALLALLLLTLGLCYLLLPLLFGAHIIDWFSRLFIVLCQQASNITLQYNQLGTLYSFLWALGILLTGIGILQYARQTIRKRSQTAYDMGFSLRFPLSNN